MEHEQRPLDYTKEQICGGCQGFVKMFMTPGGLIVCPRCGYSPSLNRRVASSSDTNAFPITPPKQSPYR